MEGRIFLKTGGDSQMTTNQLRHFLCLAETGSMNKAAASLYMTQQALSKSINNLEEEQGGDPV